MFALFLENKIKENHNVDNSKLDWKYTVNMPEKDKTKFCQEGR